MLRVTTFINRGKMRTAVQVSWGQDEAPPMACLPLLQMPVLTVGQGGFEVGKVSEGGHVQRGEGLRSSVLLGTSGDLLARPVQAWLEWRQQRQWRRGRKPGEWNISLRAPETPGGPWFLSPVLGTFFLATDSLMVPPSSPKNAQGMVTWCGPPAGTQPLPSARHCSHCLLCRTSFSPHSKPMKSVVFLSPISLRKLRHQEIKGFV